jgi:hypothetical protein
MSFTVDWDDEQKHAVIITYGNAYTWDEYEQALDQTIALIKSVPHQVDLIIDMREGARNPPAGSMFPHIRKAAERLRQEPNFGKSVMVGANPFLQTMSRVFAKLPLHRPDASVMVASMQEARRIVLKDRTG